MKSHAERVLDRVIQDARDAVDSMQLTDEQRQRFADAFLSRLLKYLEEELKGEQP